MIAETHSMPVQDFSDIDLSSLPRPEDDGGADHLKGCQLPNIPLAATNDETIDLSR
jgi:hypothetical protein